MAVRSAKTQISLGIRPVWSESLLSAWSECPGWSESSLDAHSFFFFGVVALIFGAHIYGANIETAPSSAYRMENEALPRVLGNRWTRAIFHGSRGTNPKNKGNRETQAILGNREHRKSRFCFRGTRPFFRGEEGNRYPLPPGGPRKYDCLVSVSYVLTHICLVDPSILINWTSPFPFLGMTGVLFHFYSISNRYFC